MNPALRVIAALGLSVLVGCGGGGGGGSDAIVSNAAVSNAAVSETPESHTAEDNHATEDDHTVSNFDWQLPSGFPTPREAESNPMTTAKVELGRYLFYDFRMSISQTTACASCHLPALAFTDGRITSVGATGEVHPRNAMSLTNVVYNSTFDWANPVLRTLHDQALTPLFNEFPVELGWTDSEVEILDRFRFDPVYRDLFADAYPDTTDPYTVDSVTKAVAAFVATLISGNSAYDKTIYQGDDSAMSAAARRGEALFFSERLECFHCHGGFNFSQSVDHHDIHFEQAEFHNNGLYNIGGTGDYPAGNRGLWDFTHEPDDMGRFRPPTLRNIELSAPYMHDGSIATLAEVIDHYARGGRLISDGPFAGDGALSPFKSELILSFPITEEEKADLIAFFQSLTDWEFLCDPRFADPFGNFPPHPRCATLPASAP